MKWRSARSPEPWSFVESKQQQRWLWHAIDHQTGEVLAYVSATREDEAFLELKALLAPFGITQFHTDGWGAYQRHLDSTEHTVGKCNTQKIERKHLSLRTRIKRLARKTVRGSASSPEPLRLTAEAICFSKSVVMHDIVIGLFINRFEFGRAV